MDVGARLRLIPYWERGAGRSDRIELIIDPGPSFGAGDHPSTVMALELLEFAISMAKATGRMPTLLDVGTGTGVLAVAAKALGAGFTLGLDIDPAAVFVARRNAELNSHCYPIQAEPSAPIHMVVGGAECVKGRFDIVTANLAAPTLLSLRDNLVTATGSLLILSGIADAMADEVVGSYSSAGCLCVMRFRRDEWNASLFEKRDFVG